MENEKDFVEVIREILGCLQAAAHAADGVHAWTLRIVPLAAGAQAGCPPLASPAVLPRRTENLAVLGPFSQWEGERVIRPAHTLLVAREAVAALRQRAQPAHSGGRWFLDR